MPAHEFIALSDTEWRSTKFVGHYEELVKANECVIVRDSIIMHNYKMFKSVLTHFVCTEIPTEETGLNYYGITVIPNSSLPKFIDVLYHLHYAHNESRGISKLITLSTKAKKENKAIVHFGI